jgi:DNA-binding NarL/FixJ family response regulator
MSTTPAEAVRVVVVDDHRMFRTGVKAELEEVAGDRIDIIGEAPDVDTAIAVIRRDLPDVVLLDVHLPGGNGRGGVDVLAGCVAVDSRRGRPVRFLALSVSPTRPEDVIAVVRGGARGYVTKTITGAELIEAVCSASPTATPSSHRGWRASCSMPSPGAPPRTTRSSTG